LLDVDLGMRSLDTLTEEEILNVYELKTAGYTTEGPLHMGAVLGGAEGHHLALLSEYAVPLGIAFQIQDDLLGMFGAREATGKDEGSDLLEAKRTPLVLKAWHDGRPTSAPLSPGRCTTPTRRNASLLVSARSFSTPAPPATPKG
jgi:geranylgeranyl diphosphate synthase type I